MKMRNREKGENSESEKVRIRRAAEQDIGEMLGGVLLRSKGRRAGNAGGGKWQIWGRNATLQIAKNIMKCQFLVVPYRPLALKYTKTRCLREQCNTARDCNPDPESRPNQ